MRYPFGMTQTAARIYSDKQHRFAMRLAGERDVPVAGRTHVEANLIDRLFDLSGNHEVFDPESDKVVTTFEASAVIDWLQMLPRKQTAHVATAARPAATAPTELTPGLYKVDGQVYVVKPNQAKTRLYAKALVEIHADRVTDADTIVQIEYEYAAGAIYQIKPEHRMSFDEAKKLNVRYGKCVMCGAKLKAAKSVKDAEENGGFGPICVTYVR